MFWKIFKRKRSKEDAGYAFDSIFVNEKIKLSHNSGSWVEDSFVNYNDEELASTDKNYLGVGLSNSRFIIFLICLLLGLFVLFTRAAYLQVVKGEYYGAISNDNRIRVYNIPSPRGIIYDRTGIPLVKNVPSFAVYVTPNDYRKNEDNQQLIKSWLDKNEIDIDFEKLESVLPTKKEYFEPLLVFDGLDYENAIRLQIESADYPGVMIDVKSKREYLNKQRYGFTESLAHILGYEGSISENEYDELRESGYLLNDSIGKIGIEKQYETELRGRYGKEQIEVNASGKAIKILAKEEVVKGDAIYLSIDVTMQSKLEQIIEDYLAKYGKRKAVAIVMEPTTGELLSMVSYPGYDNNLFSGGIGSEDYRSLIENKDLPMFNRVISGEYPSGSVIKPVIASAALNEGVVSERTSFISSGGVRIGQWFYPDWQAGGHGVTDVRKALAQSVNTYFYIVGGGYGQHEGLGVYKIKDYCSRFGLNSSTGLDLPGEKTGLLPDPEWKKEVKNEKWYIGDTYHYAIGQGDVLVTPLQVANYTSAFANGGTLYQTKLVDRIFDQDTHQEIETTSTVLNENMVDPYNITVVRQGMRQAVTSGSGRLLNSLPVSAAGKTGTAQWGLDNDPHAWFTSFAPYDNPELVVTVLVEEGEEGSKISTWIANDFYNWYFRQYK
ncbi:penicillin-binding protein 2 [Candidatus Falkowbacteria bacterium]|jgi:penicillin-binding protein 2|nr:penicillin-binding protein 2 [Candidatus Falkowbacteria bacterium]MBT7006959.1 penicillin-binding protein 2 [Candidatus Falkowbacteria bacterium]